MPRSVLFASACAAILAAVGLAAASPDHRVADAAEARDWAAVQRLIKAGDNPRARQADGATALHWAAYWDQLSAVDALVAAGADVNAPNDNGVTPLALACENRSAALAARLLAAGASANASTVTGESVLMTAARAGSAPIVQALLAHGAKVDAAEPTHQQTALMWAASERHADVVKLLVEHGADVRARSRVRRRTVQLATRYSDQKTVRGVADADLGGFTPLLFAARVGDVESARHLVAAGADPNDTTPGGASALVVATHSGQGAFARFLVDRGADVNAAGAGYTALHAAILRGDLELVKALVAHQADVHARLAKGTPSRYYSKDYAFNEDLVGATPLWLAARFGEPEMMRVLAAGGADPRAALPDGTTALMAAIQPTRGIGGFRLGDRRERYQGSADIAAKADGEDESTTIDTVTCLVGLGADVNAANHDGDTPLHVAAGLAVNRVVQLLVDRGADLRARNKNDQTPLAVTTAPPPRTAQMNYFYVSLDERKVTAELLRRLGAIE